MRIIYSLPLLITSILLVGCGSGGPDYVPVTGVVTLDGEPLARKTVMFVPEDGTPGAGAGGNTGEDGSYKLLAVAGGSVKDVEGVAPGAYRVTVSEPMFPIESEMVVQGTSDDPEAAMGLPEPPKNVNQAIPSQYSSQESTPLRIQVPEDGGSIDLELTSTG